MDVIKNAKVAELIAASLIESDDCESKVLEGLMRCDGFNFRLTNHQSMSLLDSAIFRSEMSIIELVYDCQGGSVHAENLASINFGKKNVRDVLSFLIDRADQKAIKKCILAVALSWMTPERAWALMSLESALNKEWISGENLKSASVRDLMMVNAVKCKKINPYWIEKIVKSGVVKFVKNVGRYSAENMFSHGESPLVCALLQNDFKLAEEILSAGYRLNVPGALNEIELAIQENVSTEGVKFLLEVGCFPFPQCNMTGGLLVMRSEADVVNEVSRFTQFKLQNLGDLVNYDRALLIAIKKNKDEIVDLLISNGSSLDRLMSWAVDQNDKILIENVLLKRKSFSCCNGIKKINGIAL